MSDLNVCALISTLGAGLFLLGAVIGGLYIVSEDFADDGWGPRFLAIGGTACAFLMALVWAWIGLAVWDYSHTFTANIVGRALVGLTPVVFGLYLLARALRSETRAVQS